MAGDPTAVQCKRKPTIAIYVHFNPAANHYIGGRIALASVTLAVVFGFSDHTVASQSATVERVNGELFGIIDLGD